MRRVPLESDLAVEQNADKKSWGQPSENFFFKDSTSWVIDGRES